MVWYAVLLCPLILGLTLAVEITDFNQIAAAKKSPDKKITIRDLHVPAATMLDLRNLQPGTVVEFAGRLTFGYSETKGPMIQISGKNIRVEGKPGHVIDAEGQRWWDGKGGSGGKSKPIRTMEVFLDDSTINGLNFKNPATACFVANWCHNLLITNLNVDASQGDTKDVSKRAFNTDGIGVGYGENVTIINAKIRNQDDCFVTGAGKNILVDNLECIGGHGISMGSLGKGAIVENVHVKNSRIIKNMVGIRIKSGLNLSGAIRNITYENIEMKDITRYGIIVHGNYGDSGGPEGEPTPFPIENIFFKNVKGTVTRKATNIWIYLAEGSAKNWKWENIDVTGGKREVSCKGVPPGLNIRCGKK